MEDSDSVMPTTVKQTNKQINKQTSQKNFKNQIMKKTETLPSSKNQPKNCHLILC